MRNAGKKEDHGIFRYVRTLLGIHTEQELLTLLLFFVFALSVWVAQTTQNTCEAEIAFPVVYRPLPENVTINGPLPTTVNVRLRDKGSKLYGYFFHRKSLVLEIDLMQWQSPDGIGRVMLRHYEDEILDLLDPGTVILQTDPAEFPVYFTTNERKRVPVRLTGEIKPEKQYMFTGDPTVEPAEVTLFGPIGLLDSISEVCTRFLSLKSLNDTTRIKVELEPLTGVRFSHQQVDVTIPVEAYTEASIELPVVGIGFPDGYSLRCFPPKVTVSFLINESAYPSIRPDNFQIGIAYDKLKNANPNELIPVGLVSAPASARRIKWQPERVDCLIQKND